ncbi:hypothetical protein N9850_01150 [Granulosicoccus sp.]|nr:MBOAT family O-acyltransferase [Granulosicoccus sp.]MDB4222350.1 hypothetical protein [Granulosicoccus sp.]
MNLPELIVIIASLISVALVWLSPRGYGQDLVACVSLLAVALISPLSALWLLSTILGSSLLMRYCHTNRAIAAGIWCLILGAMLLLLREYSTVASWPILWIGASYFTLRQVHVIMDWWLLSTPAPTVKTLMRYNLLAPLVLAGPIHRLPNFEREIARRYWNEVQFYSGLERALFGAVLAFVIGEFAYTQVIHKLGQWQIETYFLGQLLKSTIDWVFLYIIFSGLTDLALGLAAMMGLKLEENFRKPYLACDLIDFWNCWHISLSHWCRDYVYKPITAWSRSPVIGVLLAMLVLGLWHESSLYYVIWACWQALGIIFTHRFIRPLNVSKTGPLLLVRLGSLLWLVSANPILSNALALLQ